MLSEQQQHALDEAAACAVTAEDSTHAPAEVTVAQWATESAWGQNYVARCNPFGIKQYPGCPGRELAATTEWFTPAELHTFLAKGDGRTAVLKRKGQGARDQYAVHDWFAAYPGLASAFEYHGHLVTTGLYADAFAEYENSADLQRYIRGLAAHYATDPGYARTLSAIISMPAVQQALHEARKAA
jgi:flagellum-specific peptidoglycan hydrolase FlgJ